MPKTSGLSQNLFLHGYNLSGDVGAINDAGSPRETLDVTALDKSATERIYGRTDGHLAFNSWFNDTSGQEHPALKTLPTTDIVTLWALGTALGSAAAGLVAKQMNYDLNRGDDGSLQATVETQANGFPLEWGLMITTGAQVFGGSGAGTGLVESAGTSAGAAVYLEIISGTTVTVTIEHSSNTTNGTDGTWATLVAMTAGTAPTAERKTVAGTVNKGLRVNVSGACTIACAVRRGTAEDTVAYA